MNLEVAADRLASGSLAAVYLGTARRVSARPPQSGETQLSPTTARLVVFDEISLDWRRRLSIGSELRSSSCAWRALPYSSWSKTCNARSSLPTTLT
jgi:hypothetical protein